MKLSLKLSLELSQNNINKTVSGTFSGTGCRPSCASWHKKSRPDGPSRCRSPPRKLSLLPGGMLEHAGPTEGEAGRSLGFGTGAEALDESDEGQWPGFGLQWSVDLHRLLIAAPQWCGGYHPSQSDTICIPGALATAPEFLPSTRPLADLVTIYHYIYRLVLLTSQSERVFRQSHSTSQDSCWWYLPPVYLNPLAGRWFTACSWPGSWIQLTSGRRFEKKFSNCGVSYSNFSKQL